MFLQLETMCRQQRKADVTNEFEWSPGQWDEVFHRNFEGVNPCAFDTAVTCFQNSGLDDSFFAGKL